MRYNCELNRKSKDYLISGERAMDMVQKCLAFLTLSSVAVVLGLYVIGTFLNCLREPLTLRSKKIATSLCSLGMDQLMFLLNIFGLYEQREDLDLEQDLFNMV